MTISNVLNQRARTIINNSLSKKIDRQNYNLPDGGGNTSQRIKNTTIYDTLNCMENLAVLF